VLALALCLTCELADIGDSNPAGAGVKRSHRAACHVGAHIVGTAG